MKPGMTCVQNVPHLVDKHTGCPWAVLVKQDGNEDHYAADFRLDWEGGAIFTLLLAAATGLEIPLLRIRLATQAPAEDRSSAPETMSTRCQIPAVVQVQPAQHCILVELRFGLYSVEEPPVVLVAPDPALAFRFLQPEDDPFEDLYAAGAWEAPIEG